MKVSKYLAVGLSATLLLSSCGKSDDYELLKQDLYSNTAMSAVQEQYGKTSVNYNDESLNTIKKEKEEKEKKKQAEIESHIMRLSEDEFKKTIVDGTVAKLLSTMNVPKGLTDKNGIEYNHYVIYTFLIEYPLAQYTEYDVDYNIAKILDNLHTEVGFVEGEVIDMETYNKFYSDKYNYSLMRVVVAGNVNNLADDMNFIIQSEKYANTSKVIPYSILGLPMNLQDYTVFSLNSNYYIYNGIREIKPVENGVSEITLSFSKLSSYWANAEETFLEGYHIRMGINNDEYREGIISRDETSNLGGFKVKFRVKSEYIDTDNPFTVYITNDKGDVFQIIYADGRMNDG